MEYIEGETLAARLLKGPLPLEQTLRYAIEISDALDKAHRKGATHRDILMQFLVEAVVVTFIGALIGLLLGVFLDFLIVLIAENYLSTYRFGLNPFAMVISMLMALGVGLGFGLYPARKAALLDPISALRYE